MTVLFGGRMFPQMGKMGKINCWKMMRETQTSRHLAIQLLSQPGYTKDGVFLIKHGYERVVFGATVNATIMFYTFPLLIFTFYFKLRSK